jgi:hypothetical protein
MKKHLNLILPCAMALSALAPIATAAPVVTDWSTSYTIGSSGSASGTLGGIGVNFSGDVHDLQQNHSTVFNNTGTWWYGSQTVFSPSLSVSDAVGTWGSTGVTNTLTFSSAVINPILWINSLGRGGAYDLATYVQTWTFDSPFSIISSFSGLVQLPAPYQMTQSGNMLIGQEGHGAIQFTGSFTSISWTSNKPEQSAYFQVGYDTNTGGPAPVPDQGSMALLPLALGSLILGQKLGRRHSIRR